MSTRQRTYGRQGHPPLPAHIVEGMQTMRAAGYTCPEVAEAFGVTYGTAAKYTNAFRTPEGSARHRLPAKGPQDVERERDIIERVRRKESRPSIARLYRITKQRVHQIIVDYEKRTGERVREPLGGQAYAFRRMRPFPARALLTFVTAFSPKRT
jgi:transposase